MAPGMTDAGMLSLCPIVPAHLILKGWYEVHVNQCKILHPELEAKRQLFSKGRADMLLVCPLIPSHLILKGWYDHHVEQCRTLHPDVDRTQRRFAQLNARSTKALDDEDGPKAADEPKDVPAPSRSEADEVGAEKESAGKPGDPMANKLNAASTKALDDVGGTKAADEPKDEPTDVPAPSRSGADEVGAKKKSVDKPGDPMANKTDSPAKSHGGGSSEESDSEDESSEDDGEGVYRTVWLARANGPLPIRVWIKRPRYLNDPKILGAGRGLRANRGGK